MPQYNFHTHCRETHFQCIEPAPLIILEGILLFAIPEIRELFDLKIFVDIDDDVRLLRRLERDMQERSRDLKGIRDQYLSNVKPMHDCFVEPSKRFADVIIPTDRRNIKGLSMILSKIKEDLPLSEQPSLQISTAEHSSDNRLANTSPQLPTAR